MKLIAIVPPSTPTPTWGARRPYGSPTWCRAKSSGSGTHTFGTVMARRAPLPVLQQLMGHEEVSTTMRYVDVAEADKRAAITTVFGRGSHVEASADARG